MLQIRIPDGEIFDEKTGRILTIKGRDIQLEHSLVSLSKWESKWKIPFLPNGPTTKEQIIDYVRCMTTTQNVDPIVYQCLTTENINAVTAYINDPMTATTFKNIGKKQSRTVVTSEIIYYWMISLEIPVEFQRWHLNRLLTLIHVCDEKSQPGKKMSKRDVMSQNRALNAARRRRLGTRG